MYLFYIAGYYFTISSLTEVFKLNRMPFNRMSDLEKNNYTRSLFCNLWLGTLLVSLTLFMAYTWSEGPSYYFSFLKD